ncbi:MAG TPA: methyltransferase domain-containing protein [Terriglobales bacterium]
MNDRVFSHAHAHKLEDPDRLRWLPPAQVLAALELRDGMRVADIGAGTGYFALPIANSLGQSGHVYAVDLQPEMLAKLEKKLQGSGESNVSLHQGDAGRVPLPDACCDRVLFANLWHEIPDHEAAVKEAIRLLAPQGRIAILDWRADIDSPPGPPKDIRISAQTVCEFLKQHGCGKASMLPIGEYSYIVTAQLSR